MSEAINKQVVGRYVVELHYDDSMSGTGYYHARDCDNVGRISVPGGGWTFEDDTYTYREAREQAREPILAIPLDIWDQSYTIVSPTHWEDADAFYWAPMSRAEEWGGDVAAMRACMVAELDSLADELAGRVYGYVVVGPDGEHEDSCWGFIGETDYAMSEGVAVAEWANLRDAINWANLPEWVKHAVLIRGDEWETYPPAPREEVTA